MNTQIVEIMTSPSAHPNQQWLEYAQTNGAKKRIKAWLAKYEATNLPLTQKKEEKKDKEKEKKEKKKDTIEAIATPSTIINGSLSFATNEPSGSVLIGDDSNILYSFAKCCNPMKGDDVVAYITRGRGYIIHRTDCSNLKNMEGAKDRLVPVKWTGTDLMKTYTVIAKMNPELFGEIDNAVKKHGARLKKGKLDTDGGKLTGDFMIMAESEEAIRKATSAIRTVPSVIQLVGKNEGESNTFDRPQKKKN